MSAQGDQSQEKSHAATERRIRQAREKGDIARSVDAQTAAAYLGFAAAMALAAGGSATAMGEILSGFLGRSEELGPRILGGAASDVLGEAALGLLGAMLPLLLAPGLLVLVLLIGTHGIVVAPGNLAPKLSRISPLANVRQKYGAHGLVEFAKSVAKLAAIGTILFLLLSEEVRGLAGYARVEARLMPRLLESKFWIFMLGTLGVAVIVGFADFFWQRHRHLAKLRMTHEELKEEAKESEGDPHMRASRRERARSIATNRMLLDVPKADVIVTNPEHYAVALKWDRSPQTAPTCVAKGVDEVAAAIRRRAREAGVPIRPDPPTARALHAVVEIGQEVRPEHFKAVAAAILFADDVRRRRREGAGWSDPSRPDEAADVTPAASDRSAGRRAGRE